MLNDSPYSKGDQAVEGIFLYLVIGLLCLLMICGKALTKEFQKEQYGVIEYGMEK